MRLQPKTEKQIAMEGLLPLGVYDAEVIEAEDTTSKAGNDMIRVKLKVYRADGSGSTFINDYLLEAMPGKLRHAAEVMDLLADYEAGRLASDDMVGKPVRVKVGVKIDKTDTYPPQNSVLDYVRGDGAAAPVRAPARLAASLDDEIPF